MEAGEGLARRVIGKLLRGEKPKTASPAIPQSVQASPVESIPLPSVVPETSQLKELTISSPKIEKDDIEKGKELVPAQEDIREGFRRERTLVRTKRGTLWIYKNPKTGEEVVVKSGDSQEAIEDEARTLYTIKKHLPDANVVGFKGVAPRSGDLFNRCLVLEYLSSPWKIFNPSKLRRYQTLEVVRQTLELHEQLAKIGVVITDLNHANIMVRIDGDNVQTKRIDVEPNPDGSKLRMFRKLCYFTANSLSLPYPTDFSDGEREWEPTVKTFDKLRFSPQASGDLKQVLLDATELRDDSTEDRIASAQKLLQDSVRKEIALEKSLDELIRDDTIDIGSSNLSFTTIRALRNREGVALSNPEVRLLLIEARALVGITEEGQITTQDPKKLNEAREKYELCLKALISERSRWIGLLRDAFDFRDSKDRFFISDEERHAMDHISYATIGIHDILSIMKKIGDVEALNR